MSDRWKGQNCFWQNERKCQGLDGWVLAEDLDFWFKIIFEKILSTWIGSLNFEILWFGVNLKMKLSSKNFSFFTKLHLNIFAFLPILVLLKMWFFCSQNFVHRRYLYRDFSSLLSSSFPHMWFFRTFFSFDSIFLQKIYKNLPQCVFIKAKDFQRRSINCPTLTVIEQILW